jgi:hypothetical protein
VKEGGAFGASGGAESLAEILAGGLFYGDWSTSWSTFVGAGISDRVGGALNEGAVNVGNGLRDIVDRMRGISPPPDTGDATGQDADTSSEDPPAYGESSGPAVLSEDPPAYGDHSASAPYSEDPPPYREHSGAGSTAWTDSNSNSDSGAAERDLWQQVHSGPPEARGQALDTLAELRGGRPPLPVEIGIRGSLHHGFGNVPEVRVVAGGHGPEALADARHVRDTVHGLGPDVVTQPPAAAGDQGLPGSPSATSPVAAAQPHDQRGPLTVIVSDGPLPLGDPEAAGRLLAGSGADRAVVLGPPAPAPVQGAPNAGPQAAGNSAAAPRTAPHREAAVLTRESPDGPVRARPLTTTPATGEDGTAADTGAFPGADVLLPLTGALSPEIAADLGLDSPPPRPETESTATPGHAHLHAPDGTSADSAPPPADRKVTGSGAEKIAGPGTGAHTQPSPGTYEPATDLHVESGSGSRGPGTPAPVPKAVVASPHGVTTPDARAPEHGRRSPGRLLSRPLRSGPAAPSQVRTLDGHTVPVEQIRRLVSKEADGPPQGSAVRTVSVSQRPADDSGAQSTSRQRLLGQDTYRGIRQVPPSTDGDGVPRPARTVFTGPHRPLPGAGTPEGADYFVTHGTPRTVTLSTDRSDLPSAVLSGPQFGEVLRHWGTKGGRRRPLVLFSCETGRQPEIAGLPVAQHVANRTGRTVYAPTTETGTAKYSEGNVRAVLLDGPDGPGGWRRFTPEPAGRKLDALARSAGLHRGRGPADVFVRARTLQQVRTLRGALGPDAEQRTDRRKLLRGLAFVDGLRWRTPDPAGRYTDARMTPELLGRMVTDRFGLTDGKPPTAAQYTAFLREAAALRGGGPDVSLETLLPPPLPQLPPDALVSPEDVRGLSYDPSAHLTWQLSDAPLPLSDLHLSPEDTAALISRRPDLAPGRDSHPGNASDTSSDSSSAHSLEVMTKDDDGATVRAQGREFRRVPVPGDGDCFFTSVLTAARGQDARWAGRDVPGLRQLLYNRLAGSELAEALTAAAPDPVQTVLDDLRQRFLDSRPEQDPAAAESWNRFSDGVLAGDDRQWRRLLQESPYPDLLEVAPTPAAARELGGGGLLAAAAARTGLWSSPFGDLVPVALARAADLDLRVVQGGRVTALNPAGRGGTLYVAYNGRDHYEALVPVPSAPTTPTPAAPPAPAAPDHPPLPEPASTPEFQDWLAAANELERALDEEPSAVARLAAQPAAGTPLSPGDIRVRDAGEKVREAEQRLQDALPEQQTTAGDADRADSVPMETQLERYRPPRLLTGADAQPPGPPPREVVFDDGSRLPAALVAPDGDEQGAGSSGALMSGVGHTTLRGPDLVADRILAHLPPKVRAAFDDAELGRLLADEPSAFTGPRGARFVGRERSGVGYEMTVEAVPYSRWERFADPAGGTVKLDTLRRGQGTTAASRGVGSQRGIAGALTMGSPLEWMVRLGASLGRSRRTEYNSGTQAFSQSEWRAMEGSHLHLDDVYYRVRVDRVTAPEPAGDRTEQAPAAGHGPDGTGWRRTPVHQDGFAVRDGLTWRLQDTLTEPYTGPRLAPRELNFPEGVAPRVTDTEALHLRDSPEDLALAMFGAKPGSSAHRTLVSFLRPGRLSALFGRLTGQAVGPELTRGRSQRPLGHLIVERSVPHSGTLVTEATKVELRDIAQIVRKNDRTHTRETRFGAQLTAGPNHTLPLVTGDLRIQGGPVAELGLGAGRAHHIGGSAARKVTGRVKGTPAALYRVERTVYVRRPGEPESAARPFRVTTLDWMPVTEARRLAGWDARTPGQAAPGATPEPAAPPYLTVDDPTHLGHTRSEGFLPEHPVAEQGSGPMRDFADAALDALHRSYPGLFPAAWELRHPKLARLLLGDGRTTTALHNDRQVREALNRPTLAQSLEVLTTTGVPVALTEDGTVRRGHHTMTLTARLTDRRYETSLSERSLRNSVGTTQQAGQGQQGSSTQSAGFLVGISPRDPDLAPETGWARRIGWMRAGLRHAWQSRRSTANAASVGGDHLTAQTATHLFSYQVELNAGFEGYRRPRGWARLLSLGMLGTGLGVSTVRPRPLFDGGAAPVGRVELAVPAAHSSRRYAPEGSAGGQQTPVPDIVVTPPSPTDGTTAEPVPDPDDAVTADTEDGTEDPLTTDDFTPLSAEEAEQLLDGTGPSEDPTDPREAWTRDLLSRPFAVLSAEGAVQRTRLMEQTAAAATGNSWHVTAPGTPVLGALRRAMENLSVAGHLGQLLGPFGMRTTGLHAPGPFRDHHIKATLRGKLHGLRVAGDPHNGSFEVTTGAVRSTAGSAGKSSTTTIGLQNSLFLQQIDGHHPVHGNYAAGGQYTRGRGSSSTTTVGNGRSTILTHTGRTYPVVGDLTETVAVRDRWSGALGLTGTRAAAAGRRWAARASRRAARQLTPNVRRAAGHTRETPGAVLMHVPMQDAIETGLAPDGLGAATPHHLAGGYRVPPFLRRRRFASHPTGQLDASPHARALLPQLESLGVPSHDREQVLQMLSPDFLRAQLPELTTDGVPLPIRYREWSRPGRLPTGGSPGRVRFRLRPVTTRVDRLRNGYEVEDYRPTDSGHDQSHTHGSGTSAALGVSESPAVNRDTGLLAVAPTLAGGVSEQSASTRGDGSGTAVNPNIATTQSHAELVTRYTLTVDVEDGVGDPLLDPVDGDVGTLRELLPVSLLTPEDDSRDDATVDAADTLPEPDRSVRVLTSQEALPDAIEQWRRDSDLVLDDAVGTGFLAVDMIGAPSVHDALTLATAQAEGAGDALTSRSLSGGGLADAVTRARRTPLTTLGTASAQAQQQATGPTGLTAALRDALSGDGRALPQTSSARLFGQSHTADATLYAKLDRRGARLLAVENRPRMEGAVRGKETDTQAAGPSTTAEAAAGTFPMTATLEAGLVIPAASATLGNNTDATALQGGDETGLGTHLKVATPRSMLFALPVHWLSVVETHRRITDSRAARTVRSPHTLGGAPRGPRAAGAETTALVWVREDIATDLGLLDDSTFPEEVRDAWDRMADAQADMTEAEKRYYDARARAREAWLDMTETERTAVEDGQGTAAAGEPGSGPPESVPDSPAVTAWRAARDDARQWEARTVEAAEQTHRLHAAAERLTARHHQGTEGRPAAAVTDDDHSAGEDTTDADGRTVPDDAAAYHKPGWREKTPPRFTVAEPDGDGTQPRTLTPQDGGPTLTAHPVPHDGASFFHALTAAAAYHDRLLPLLDTGTADGTGVAPTATPAEVLESVRSRLVGALGERGNEDLLAALAPERTDNFSQDELDAAGIGLEEGPQQREFAARGALPEQRWLTEGERLGLATEALSRPFGSDRETWDHGAADLLPALAARVLRAPVTVITADGQHQRFLPAGADGTADRGALGPELTLFHDGTHFHVALPSTAPAPSLTTLTPPGTSRTGTDTNPKTPPDPERAAEADDVRRPSHATPPWTPSGHDDRFRLDRAGVLTGPDGITYTQGPAAGRGNGFFDALSRAMRHAAGTPGLPPVEASRLRFRADAPPARLLRIHGLPGSPEERDKLFSPPPARPLPGHTTTSTHARERALRDHLSAGRWDASADQAMAAWAARATGARVTLVEENGTSHTFPGEGGSRARLVLRRRGGDLVPLLPRPAPLPVVDDTPPGEEDAYELDTLSGRDTRQGAPSFWERARAWVQEPANPAFPLGMNGIRFTNLGSNREDFIAKATRLLEMLANTPSITAFQAGRPVEITIERHNMKTPAWVRDCGTHVKVQLAAYYFEQYPLGYVAGMLGHEFGIHPVASARHEILDEEKHLYSLPVPAPGLPAQLMNTDGAGQPSHILGAWPSTMRFGVYRTVVFEMADRLWWDVTNRVEGARTEDITDLFHTYLMDIASIAATNDHRDQGIPMRNGSSQVRADIATVYNHHRQQFLNNPALDPRLTHFLPEPTTANDVSRDYYALIGRYVRGVTSAPSVASTIPRPATPTPATDPPPAQTPAIRDEAGVRSVADRVAEDVYQRQMNNGADSASPVNAADGADLAQRLGLDADQAADIALCVDALEQVRDGLHPRADLADGPLAGGRPVARSRDDLDLPRGRGRRRLAPDGSWSRISSWNQAADTLRPGETGLFLWHRANGPGHAIAVHRTSEGLRWIDPTAPSGQRVTQQPPIWNAVDAHALVLTADGAERPQDFSDTAQHSTAEALIDPAGDTRHGAPSLWNNAREWLQQPANPAFPLAMNRIRFTNLGSNREDFIAKATRLLEMLANTPAITAFQAGRPVNITLERHNISTPAWVRDRGTFVEVQLAAYYFEKYPLGYVAGMLGHEFGIHPVASARTEILEEEQGLYDLPVPVPGLPTELMNTMGAGQPSHILGAWPSTMRFGVYRTVVFEMADRLWWDVTNGVEGARAEDITDLLHTYLMDLASIAATNDHRDRGVPMRNGSSQVRANIATVYNHHRQQFLNSPTLDPRLTHFLPGPATANDVSRDYYALIGRYVSGVASAPSVATDTPDTDTPDTDTPDTEPNRFHGSRGDRHEATHIPPRSEAAPTGIAADLAKAWDAHARSRTALAEVAVGAALMERNSGDETGMADAWAAVDEARRRMEDAEARLWALGVPPDTLGAARSAGEDADTDDGVPVVPRDAGRRRWIAGQVTEDDLPPNPPEPAPSRTVGLEEIRTAGITLSPGLQTEMMLRGDDRLPEDVLSPLDLTRVRMMQPGTWSQALDTAAANASRRLWSQAYADFAGAAPEDTDEAQTTRAWRTAVTLVLPAEPHPVLADSRYADDGFRDAVRRVADHLLDGWTDARTAPVSAAELADVLRSDLGLRPRWTVPATEE